MAQLAIIEHSTRGKEVITLLEMLGGINAHNLYGDESYAYYTIDSDKEIKGGIYVFGDEQLCHFTLEEFLEKYPYKVGDKVLYYGYPVSITQMEWIEDSVAYHFYYKGRELMLPAKHLQPYGEENFGECVEKAINLFGDNEDTMEEEKNNWAKWDLPDGYEFQDKEGNVIDTDVIRLVKKQPQYPKTYKECCEVLGINTMDNDAQGYRANLIICFQELLIARNAYWEIAGEEMGLGKPWEPDFKDNQDKYFICYVKDEVWKSNIRDCNRFLVFPTEEMRDEFYENFKDSIKTCKNLI